ncbi:MAG TPA: hypothetical protein VK489_14400 [Ferruginibacter sp.]|nr:hypothetical protein [Ferruginibacter sp.]
MHFLITIIFCISINTGFGQKNHVDSISDQLKLKENTIYMFCRGTSSKSSLIAHGFNLMDTNITHIGIGFVDGTNIRIYNVSDNAKALKSALVIDSLGSYIGTPGVFYFSVWETNNSSEEFNRLKASLKEYASRQIVFDPFFRINADDTLYCSEFCAMVLARVNSHTYSFKPTVSILNNAIIESYLGRKKISYFPVDFFEINSNFRKMFSYKFK